MQRTKRLRSKAWLLRGVSSLPGILSLDGHRLTFTATVAGSFWRRQLQQLEQETKAAGLAERMLQGEHTVLLDAALADVRDVTFPWYYFTGGGKLSVRDVRYRFSFARPTSTRVVYAVARLLQDIDEGRGQGRLWKAVLSGKEQDRWA